MIANYHTHTVRCNHAKGTEEEYVLKAIEGGYRTLGFSDHTPQLFAGDYYSGFRMRPELFRGYCDTLLALREKYAGRIDIKIGVEAEYYPGLFGRLRDFLADYPVDYMIMGQHALGNEENDHFSGIPTKDESILKRYVDQVIEGLSTGKFTYLAHPDLFNFIGDDETFRRHMLRLCEFALEHGIPLEINCLGIDENRTYPCDRFFKIAGEVGNSIIIGCDAHYPELVYKPEILSKAYDLAQRHSLKLIDDVELRSIK